jgi:hypothetical protein
MKSLKSPENFQGSETMAFRLANKMSRGVLSRSIESWRIWKKSDGQSQRTFFVDWKAKPYNRIALVNLLLAQFKKDSPARYLEIGCARDVLFHAVFADEKVGVDPFSGGTLRMTSDEFFLSNSHIFEVVFIDGLHEYHQVWRDIKNALEIIPVGGYIGIHDMLPRDWIEAHVPCLRNGPWAGDVWKVGFDLADNPSIDFEILNIDHGVGVIKKLKNDAASRMQANFSTETYSYYADRYEELPIVEFEQISL